MTPPKLTPEDVCRLLPFVTDVEFICHGGQKTVFSAQIEGIRYALKFIEPGAAQVVSPGLANEETDISEIRARREVETMQQCGTPHLVTIGPIGMETGYLDSRALLYFSEEYVEGETLREYVQSNTRLSDEETVSLGLHIAKAIGELWKYRKVHRDIKPQNIMRRSDDGSFVLLDMGMVFDLDGDSLSSDAVGTPAYFSPEQARFTNRRTELDFRSDLFSLGVVMYEARTGAHPFKSTDSTTYNIVYGVVNSVPPAPISIDSSISKGLDGIIIRLLNKRPHLRYRKLELFERDLDELSSMGDGQ